MTKRSVFFKFSFAAVIFISFAVVLSPCPVYCAWSDKPTVNTPICTASGDQCCPRIISDGSGGAIIAWPDNRYDNSDIFAQRVDGSGDIQWGSTGKSVSTEKYGQATPEFIVDGSGGAIITWNDYRNENLDIYAQRINSSGITQWTENGVAICTSSKNQKNPQIVSDGSGGAIITWHDYRSGNSDIYAQRVNSSGVTQWIENGVAICTASEDQEDPQIISDGSGGAIITWDHGCGISSDVYAQRVNASGITQWTENGVAMCTSSGDRYDPAIISDLLGGAIITWKDYRNSNPDIYIQRVDKYGDIQWGENGVAVCTATETQSSPQITGDGLGGAIITWYDNRAASSDIYAQRVNYKGGTEWKLNGVPICTANGIQNSQQITGDGLGGAIITWYDNRAASSDIYAQRVNSSGAIQWAENGIAICTAGGVRIAPQIISDGSGGAIITWYDYRSGSPRVYAQRIEMDGFLGPAPCDACNGEPVILSNEIFEPGTNCECRAATYIRFMKGVTVKDGAKATFIAPNISVDAFFQAEEGSRVFMKQE